VDPTALVLLHSPLTSVTAWGRLPRLLGAAAGVPVHVVDVDSDDRPPFATRYVAAAAGHLATALRPGEPVLLVAHSAAGPLLPQLAFARRAAHGPVRGYVFLDALLPRPGGPASRLDLLAAEDPGLAAARRTELEAGRSVPSWSSEDLAEDLPDPADRAALLAGVRPRPLAYYTEPVPFPGDWPDAPCGFLRTSAAYDWSARVAAGRGWPVESIDAGHFAALAQPADTAAALLRLITRM
jgi:Alpha/beta hydrolase family